MLYVPTPALPLISSSLPLLRRCLALLLLLLVGLVPLRAQAAAEPVTACTTPGPVLMDMVFGQFVGCSLTYVGATDMYRFQGEANSVAVLSLRTEANNGSACNTYEFCAIAKLYAPGSNPNTDPPLLSLDGSVATAVKTITLPATGTYLITIKDDNNAQTGTYRFGLDRLFPASPTSRLMDFNQTKVVTDNISPVIDQDFYIFDGGQNDQITLNISTGLVAGFYGPDQTLLATINGGTPLFTTLPSEGRYTLHVRDSGNDEARQYSVNLACLVPGNGSTQCGPNPPPNPTCKGITPTLLGTTGNDTLIGTAGKDIIAGLGGHDRISGLGGDDIICGDSDQGGAGNDTLFGGDGNDTLIGGDGVNVLFGEAGNDTLTGGTHRDSLFGGAGNDNLDGKSNDDVLIGGAGNDLVNGNTGTRDICDKAADDLTPAKGCEFKGTP